MCFHLSISATNITINNHFSNGGGGGERVLWRAVQETLAEFAANRRSIRCVVYTGDCDVDATQILKLCQVCLYQYMIFCRADLTSGSLWHYVASRT